MVGVLVVCVVPVVWDPVPLDPVPLDPVPLDGPGNAEVGMTYTDFPLHPQ